MYWYKRHIMFTNVFNTSSIELKNFLFEQKVLNDVSVEEIENFDINEINRIENTNCGAFIKLDIYLGFDDAKEDGGLCSLKKMLKGIENQLVFGYVKDSKVIDDNILEFLNSKFTLENLTIDKNYLDGTDISECVILCTHLIENPKIDIKDEIELKKIKSLNKEIMQ